ncbi:MAG: hypothetical protein GX558_07030 [Clostridiales bacterium]|nr:hypothetical protein [Clostridiales bacterium]
MTFKPRGDLAARMVKNLARLQDRPYRPGVVGGPEAQSPGWPGDWEGRTLLSLTLLEEALGVEAPFLDDAFAWVRSTYNAQGYRGEPIDPADINEQAFASHSWLMRAFLERARATGDVRRLADACGFLEQLYLPVLDHLAHYPEGGSVGAAASGPAVGQGDRRHLEWRLSSDVGCLFISLDGLSQAYQVFGGERLRLLIDGMCRKFGDIDFLAAASQTHATLTGARGVMRMHAVTGEARYLALARRIFELYLRHGMTENLANFNFFGVPCWTEPCGCVDSFMLAMQLCDATGERRYLHLAHDIWHSGVLRGQRDNGGFGCDRCTEDGWLGAHSAGLYEAFWCCTMRGSEGLTWYAKNVARDADGAVELRLYADGDLALAGGSVRLSTGYPLEGRVRLRVRSGDGRPQTWRFFVPDWAAGATIGGAPAAVCDGFAQVTAPLVAGSEIELAFDIPPRLCGAQNARYDGQGLFTLRHGPLVLGCEAGYPLRLRPSDLKAVAPGRYAAGQPIFAPFDDSYLLTREQLLAKRWQVLFRTE